MGKRHRLTNILFLAPAVVSFSLVMIVPFFLGIYYSMTDFNGIRSVLTFVGFDNYQVMFSEPAFLYSFLVTVEYTAINIVLVNVVACRIFCSESDRRNRFGIYLAVHL